MQKIQKKKKKKKRTKKFTFRDHQQWQITSITLNINGLCLLSIYPPRPAAINPTRF